jgi:GDP-L-fucose synthase
MCVYGADAPLPYREDELFKGLPDADIASYGIAKLAILQGLRAFAKQHALRGAYVIPVNLFGPGDNIADEKNSHVAGALMRRFVEAADTGVPEVVCWGTGAPTRDFIFVDDAAEGVVRAGEVVDDFTPINIASGAETSIKSLAETIARLAGYRGRIVWDAGKGDGVSRRCLDITRAQTLLRWSPRTSLEDGLSRTIAWYRESRR